MGTILAATVTKISAYLSAPLSSMKHLVFMVTGGIVNSWIQIERDIYDPPIKVDLGRHLGKKGTEDRCVSYHRC